MTPNIYSGNIPLDNEKIQLEKEGSKKAQELISLFQSFDAYRKQWEEDAIRNYKLYRGWKEKLDEEQKHRSNLHIPRTYQIVDTIRSRFVNTFFGQRPYIEFTPAPQTMSIENLETAEDKAKVASALVDEQLDKNNIVAKYYDYITQMLIFPSSVMGVGWRYEEKEITRRVPQRETRLNRMGQLYYTGEWNYNIMNSVEAIWDDNEIKNIDFFDFWPDPKGTDLDDCRGVFQREFITYEQLIEKLKFLNSIGLGTVYPVDYEELMETDAHQVGREERMSKIGKSTSMKASYFDSDDSELKAKSKFELLHYWEDDRHAILINRTKCVYDGPSPYWRHHMKPFIVESFDRIPNEFYGLSAIDVFADLQEEENAIHNQRNDNINLVVNKMFKARRGRDIDESDLISQPHGIIWVDQMDDVELMPMDDVASSSFSQQAEVARAAEQSVGATPIVQGAEGRSDKTATEAMELSSNAGQRFSVKTKVMNYKGIKRLAAIMDGNNQQFIAGDRLVRILPEEGRKWRWANPGNLIGEFDYRPAGSALDPTVNKEVQREQLSHMMQFLFEAQIPFIKYHELIKEWINSFDFEHANKFVMSAEEWQAKQQEMQQEAMMQEQQMGAEGRGPQAGQAVAAQEGAARGRRPQSPRNPRRRESGNIR